MILNLRRVSWNVLIYPACSWQQFVVQAGDLCQSIIPGSKHQDIPTLCRNSGIIDQYVFIYLMVRQWLPHGGL